ncbi:MAG: methyltransferase [Sediminibacterium sp.]|nr:methyltransferase [Sediminibacterium sp.]
MLSKNELKYIQSLCQKKQRQEERLFIAEGTKLVDELLNSHYTIRKVYALAEWVQKNVAPVDVVTITAIELAKISSLQTPNQVLAVVEQQTPAREPATHEQLTLVLDGIQDPGNFGTIIRIADWFGIKQVIASEDTVELYNPKVIQSTMGSFLRVDVWYKPLHEFLASTKIPVYGALLNGKNMHGEPPVTEGLLVIGNESKGISKELLPFISHPITIPRLGGAESLNAAVAAGIIVSHLKKA